jgi:hypothetical protein
MLGLVYPAPMWHSCHLLVPLVLLLLLLLLLLL